MRRANGTGSVYKLSGKRHKPWTARATEGYKENGQATYKYIGYYATKKEAVQALEKYQYIPEQKVMTVEQAWEGYQKCYQGRKSTLESYKSGYKRLISVKDVLCSDLSVDQMQECVSTKPCTYATASQVKKVLNAILDYAYSRDCCPGSRRGLLKYLVMPERPTETKARALTEDEIRACITEHAIGPLFLIFTGLRKSEMLSLQGEDIDLVNQVITVKTSKTKAGIRTVPIPTGLLRVAGEIKAAEVGKHSKTYFDNHFWNQSPIKSATKHDCRHTYITLLTKAEVPERVIKRLVGHAGGVTQDVYTHYDMDYLIATVDKAFGEWLSDSERV